MLSQLFKLPSRWVGHYEKRRWNRLGLRALSKLTDPSVDNYAHLRVAIEMTCKVAEHKDFVEDPRYIYVEPYTRSTRALIGNIQALYNRPPGIWEGDAKRRAAYDWCYTDTGNGIAIKPEMLNLVLTDPKRSTKAWEHSRSLLVSDVILYCTLVLGRMTFR